MFTVEVIEEIGDQFRLSLKYNNGEEFFIRKVYDHLCYEHNGKYVESYIRDECISKLNLFYIKQNDKS